jgi:hypothetical protein
METVVIIAAIGGFLAYWYWPKKSLVVPTIQTVLKPIEAVKETGAPRWHRYDVLLELQICLREHGGDEKVVKEICDKAAQILLGDKK